MKASSAFLCVGERTSTHSNVLWGCSEPVAITAPFIPQYPLNQSNENKSNCYSVPYELIEVTLISIDLSHEGTHQWYCRQQLGMPKCASCVALKEVVALSKESLNAMQVPLLTCLSVIYINIDIVLFTRRS